MNEKGRPITSCGYLYYTEKIVFGKITEALLPLAAWLVGTAFTGARVLNRHLNGVRGSDILIILHAVAQKVVGGVLGWTCRNRSIGIVASVHTQRFPIELATGNRT